MPRIRTIKPELAAHEELFDLERETGLPIRFAWCMLFTSCDREGRFKWRPKTLKSQILPHDEIDFSRVLHAWLTRGLIVKYRVGEQWFGVIPTWRRHQVVNHRESPSELPSPEDADETECIEKRAIAHASSTRDARDHDAASTRPGHARGEGKGKEKKGKEGNGQEEGDRGNRELTLASPPDVPTDSGASGKSRKTRRPASFELSAERRQYAEERLPDVDAEALFGKFCEQADSKAWAYADWHKAWQVYIGNCMPESGHWASGQYPRLASASKRIQAGVW